MKRAKPDPATPAPLERNVFRHHVNNINAVENLSFFRFETVQRRTTLSLLYEAILDGQWEIHFVLRVANSGLYLRPASFVCTKCLDLSSIQQDSRTVK